MVHLGAIDGGAIYVESGCIVGSGMGCALSASGNGNIFVGSNIEILDNLAWSGACLQVTMCGTITFYAGTKIVDAGGVAPTGNTGQRYSASSNGAICTNGGGASFAPGSVAGATLTGGQYI